MPQETNLNVAPYFDDFDKSDKYYKVLFKPGYPVQARELTGIQSILQDQIEKFGSHAFKEGSSVTGGGVKFTNGYNSILVQADNEGYNVRDYLFELNGKVLVGSQSGIKAKILGYLPNIAEDGTYTFLYIANPYLENQSYDILSMLIEVHGRTRAEEYFKLWLDCFSEEQDTLLFR